MWYHFFSSYNNLKIKFPKSRYIKLLELINKNYIKSIENKDDIDKNIRLNVSYLTDFYLYFFKEMKGVSVLQKHIIIDPDEIRKLLAPWGYDKTNVVEFYDLSGELNDKVFELVKEQMKAIGEKNIVFVTGAPASGKSRALKKKRSQK